MAACNPIPLAICTQRSLAHSLVNRVLIRYGSHLGKARKKTTENLKPQPERLLLSAVRVTLGEKKYVSDDTLHNLKHLQSKFSAHNLSNIVSSSFDQPVYTRLSSAEEDDELGPMSSTSSGDEDEEEFCEGLSIVASSASFGL